MNKYNEDIITNDYFRLRMTQLAKIVSSIEQKISNLSNFSFNNKSELSVDSVNMKIDQYVKTANEALRLTSRVEELEKNYKIISNSLKKLKEDNKRLIYQMEKIPANFSQKDGKGRIPFLSRLRILDDTVSMANALYMSGSNDYRSEVNDAKSKFISRISTIENVISNV